MSVYCNFSNISHFNQNHSFFLVTHSIFKYNAISMVYDLIEAMKSRIDWKSLMDCDSRGI